MPYLVGLMWVLASIGITACGSTEPTVPEVTLEASSGPAGSVLTVYGLDVDACPLRTSEIKVGGETAPAVLDGKGEVLMRLPLFYDEDLKWAAPPSGPQDVEIYCKGTLLTTLLAAITVTELQPAPGTTAAIVANYAQILSDYERLASVLAPEPGIQQQIFSASLGTLDVLLRGSEPESLPVLFESLAEEGPEILAIMDAVYAAGHLDEAVAAFRSLLEEMSAHAVASEVGAPSGSALATAPLSASKAAIHDWSDVIPLSDLSLAKGMQAYVVLDSFSKDFVEQTAGGFSYWMDWLELFGVKSRVASVVGATLFFADFIMNKLVVSALPAKLKEIDLTILQTELQNSEVVACQFTVEAFNVPAQLSITNIKDLVLQVLGLASSDDAPDPGEVLEWVDRLEKMLPDITKFALNMYERQLKEYAALNPGIFQFDRKLFAIVPDLKFLAIGETRELYELQPNESNVIHPLDSQLKWQASETHWGSAELYITPGAGPEDGFWGSLYRGRAFGESSTRSNGVRVKVGELALVLEQHSVSVPEDDIATVGVKLSHSPAEQEDSVDVYAKQVSGDPDISVVSRHPLVFDDTNWNDYKYVVLAAAEDEDDEDGEATISVSADVDVYGEGPITIEASIAATEEDNDRLGFVTSTHKLSVPEGETATFDVKLNQEPPSAVTATVTRPSGDTDITVQSPLVLRFDAGNWDTYRTVTLYARPDEDLEIGSAQIRIASHTLDIDDRFITATEVEDIEPSLTITFEEWNDDQKLSVVATVPVTLDPENYRYPLGVGTGDAHQTGNFGEFVGTVHLEITNYPYDQICYGCGPICYDRQSSDDVMLEIWSLITWADSGSRAFTVLVPFGQDSVFEWTGTCPDSTVSYDIRAELIQ